MSSFHFPQFKVKPGKGEYIVFDKRPDGSAWVRDSSKRVKQNVHIFSRFHDQWFQCPTRERLASISSPLCEDITKS